MFKLDRLEINGFKSFVDPVTVDFAGGLTAIVGPNGCGKSNIADAVMWVIGERSAKHLRGSTMEDVIFNGAEGRRPLGTAEVTLTLETDPSFAGSDDGRLVLGRQVFRSGESIYKMNGKRVRLKEIKDLLMDTGLGLREYSVIEQGRIGMILSGKPQERRKLLEEAAGITRYRERRRVAEIKLEEARANLARLDDIVDEVKRSLRSLKRQANAARRYREREERYRSLLRRVLTGRWARLTARLDDLEARIAELTGEESELTARISSDEAAVARSREEVEAIASDLADRHRRQGELGALIEGRQQFLEGSRERLEEIAERLSAGRALAERRRREVTEERASLGEMEERFGELEEELERAASDVDQESERIRAVEAACREAEEKLEGLRERLLTSLGNLSTLRNRLHHEEVEQEKGRYRRGQLESEAEAREEAVREAAEALEEGAERAHALATRVEEGSGRLAEERRELERLAARQGEVAEERQELGEELAEARRRRRLLEELSEAQSERRQAFVERLAEAGVAEPAFLADRVEAPRGWERAVDLYLGDLADAALLPADADAVALARRLSSGRGTGRLLQGGDGTTAAPAVDDPAIFSSLAEALDLPRDLAAALPAAYLVESAEDAWRLARRHPGIAFVARDRLWARSGTLHVQGEASEPGALARQHELAQLAERIPRLEEEHRAAGERLDALAADHREKEEEIRRAEESLGESRRELAVARARHEDLEGRHRRLGLERETVAQERAEIDREIARLDERVRHHQEQLAEAEERHKGLESRFDEAQKQVQQAREERESVRTAGASSRGHLKLVETRLDSHRRDLERTRRAIADGERQSAEWLEEEKRLEERRDEIRRAVARAEEELQEALESRAAAEEEVVARQEELDAARADLARTEASIRSARGDLDDVRARLGTLKEERAGARQDSEHLHEEFRAAFDEELPEEPGEPPEELDRLADELGDHKRRLDKMGPVNLLAAEEYAEQEERLEFLTEQHDDVARSVDSLKQTIREINQTSSQRFLEAFEQVNEIFGRTFQDLFRGGEASMHLLDEDDVLESGIEIVARPPGKRLQNIMLLSGGEKALTAIALIFALFRTKPSPFCVLDEVDAPLDDVNTLRFVELLKQLSGDTQFVVITHNKITMEAAAVLYGVTMQERGVSKIVSVELDEIHPVAAAAGA